MFTKSRSDQMCLCAQGFPAAEHPMEPDLFSRQVAMQGHNQTRLEQAHVGIVGCGGLGSWIGVGLARMGIRRLTLFDPDVFDRTNAPRQLMGPDDLGRSKAAALAKNLLPHMSNAGTIRAVPEPAEETWAALGDVTALVVGVDNNRARLAMAEFGLRQRIPVIFAMLSLDGLRAQIFLQAPNGPCLACVLPNADPHSAAPCAAASIASCFLAASHAVHATAMAIMATPSVTWRETSLDGSTDRTATPPRRRMCRLCSGARDANTDEGSDEKGDS